MPFHLILFIKMESQFKKKNPFIAMTGHKNDSLFQWTGHLNPTREKCNKEMLNHI